MSHSKNHYMEAIVESVRRLLPLLDTSIGVNAHAEMIVLRSALTELDTTHQIRLNTPAIALRKSVLLLLQTINAINSDDKLKDIAIQVHDASKEYDKWRTAITTRKVNEIRSLMRSTLIDLLFPEGEMSHGHHQLLNGYLDNSDLFQQIHDHIKELE